jgi:acetamidase/formamidase
MNAADVERAAIWLADQKETPQQVIHLLRERFGITAVQAAQALTLANQFRVSRRAFG